MTISIIAQACAKIYAGITCDGLLRKPVHFLLSNSMEAQCMTGCSNAYTSIVLSLAWLNSHMGPTRTPVIRDLSLQPSGGI